MENPYDVESRSELAYHNVWNEGDTNGYARGKAERAEIVSELVEALELTLWIIDGGKVYIGKPGTWQLPKDLTVEPREVLAIAKAKGE